MKLFLVFTFLPLFIFSKNIKSNIAPQENKVKRSYYRDGIISIESWFGTDKIIDSLKTYHKSGKSNEIFYFNNGRFHGECIQNNSLGEKIITWNFNNGELLNRINHKVDYTKDSEEIMKKALENLVNINIKTNYKPTSFKDIYERAYSRYKLGNTTLALQDFKRLEKVVKSFHKKTKFSEKLTSNIYDAIGDIYSGYENDNYAIHYRYKALKVSPNDGRLLYNLGAYLFTIKAYRLSLEYLNKAKEIWPNHAFTNWTLGALYSDLEEYDKALEFINIAYKNEEHINLRNSGRNERNVKTIRGYINHKLGNTEQGIIDLNKALEVNKNNSYALRNLGVIYTDLEEYSKACAYLKKSKKLGYEKVFDKNDLQYYIDNSCNAKTKKAIISLADKPYVYPNPVAQLLYLKNYPTKNFQFEIFDFQSKLVKKGTADGFYIDISIFKPGLYILRIVNTDTPQAFKIIKK